ncbi:MAG TPA: sulfotransferase [Terriglobales bacterium]
MPQKIESYRTTWTRWTQPFRRASFQPSQLLPSFLIVGPPRTGTSWLHEVLRKRAVLPKSVKETRFFDAHFHHGMSWYRAHYAVAEGNGCIGEVAPTYFASQDARRRIKALLPDAKIVCIFRDPVERILSLYRVKRAYGIIPWSFEQAILCDPELTESSRYATHLKAWQRELGADQVWATLYDDLRDTPQAYVNRLADFLGIPRFSLSPEELGSVHASETMTHPRCYLRTRSATLLAEWLKARHFGHLVAAVKSSPLSKLFLGGGLAFSGLSRELSLATQELFRREIDELEEMVQRDLSSWKPLQSRLTSTGVAV